MGQMHSIGELVLGGARAHGGLSPFFEHHFSSKDVMQYSPHLQNYRPGFYCFST